MKKTKKLMRIIDEAARISMYHENNGAYGSGIIAGMAIGIAMAYGTEINSTEIIEEINKRKEEVR